MKATRFRGEWETRTLRDVADCLDHLRIPLNAAQRRQIPGPYPYCGANGVVDHIGDYVLDDDVILIAEDGGYFEEHAHRPIAYRMTGKIWVNNHAHVLKAKPGFSQAFLFFALVHKDIQPFLASGTRSKLNRGEMDKIAVCLPRSATEQRAIAAVLSDVDELIGSLEALIAKKRAIKQAAMQELLTGRTRLPGFGGEWEMKRLEEVAVVTMGQSPPSASYNVAGNGLPLIQGNADIARRTTIDRIWTTLPSKRCDVGDIVLTVRAPVGSVARASKGSCLGRGVCGLKPLGNGRFLYYGLILRESRWEDVEQGSTFSAANSAQVAGFPIAVPMDLAEQRAIATILSDMDAEIAALDRRLDKTRVIKQGMMQQLLTGSIRLPIPDDDTEDGDAHDA